MGDEWLCKFFFGKTTSETMHSENDYSMIEDEMDGAAEEEGAQEKPKIGGAKVITPHFGASQVIIVRD